MAKQAIGIHKIANFESTCLDDKGELKVDTAALVQLGKTIGLSHLTKDTFDTWVLRTNMLDHIDISLSVDGENEWWPTELTFKSHFGLEIVCEALSDEEFDKKALSILKKHAREHGIVKAIH